MIKAEWTNADALNLQPTCNQLATDCISRQAAIDAVNDVIADYIPNIYGRYEALPLEMASAINRLPSAQQEIIRCRNCKYHDGIRCFRWNSTIITNFDDFCSNAERKEGEEDE